MHPTATARLPSLRGEAAIVTRKQSTKQPQNPYQTSATGDELSQANRIAYEVLVQRRDLLPSVDRIMNAGLTEDEAVAALTLFRNALTDLKDPNRDPRVAIAAVAPAARAET